MDTKLRSAIKSCSWRLVALINGFLVTSLYVNDYKKAFIISVWANITGWILYYFHERLWNATKFGRISEEIS